MITDYFVFALFFMLALLSIYYDYRENRIPNKMILVFLVLTIILQTLCLVLNSREYFRLFMLCIIQAVIISICFYELKIWAGGDTKLFVLMSMLVPGVVYKQGGYGSIVAIVIIIYSLSFVYIIFESLFFYIKNKEALSIRGNTKRNYLCGFLGWLFVFSLIGLFQNCFLLFLSDIYSKFSVLFMFFKVIIVLVAGKYYSKVFPIIKGIVILLYIISSFVCIYQKIHFSFDINSIVLVTIIFFIRFWAGRYNYQKINVNELKKGMILSAGTVLGFINSNIKGLPVNINEDMSARLNEEEISSILKWSNSKNGSKEIVVVRRIPFAIFISLGFSVYIIGMIIWSNI